MNEVTSIGNEGFCIRAGPSKIYIDAFFYPIATIADPPALRAKDVTAADLILVTHAHMDHFNAGDVAQVACRTGATVIGPGEVIRALAERVPPALLKEMEPPAADAGMASSVVAVLPCATVTAFRTFHGRAHNSYLVETQGHFKRANGCALDALYETAQRPAVSQGFRFFHDGDNEDTTRLPLPALARLDALLIGPWKDSGWVEFIEKAAPARYFLMHLTGRELDEHEAGRFLPDICDRVPEGIVVLRPGQTFVFPHPSHA